MKKSNYYFTAVLTILLFAYPPSIQAFGGNKGWSATYDNPKVFIENKGQFHTYNPKETVLYAYDDGLTRIYFTSKGISYSFVKPVEKEGKEKERERENRKSGKSHAEMEAEEHKVKYKTDVVNFIWENANPDLELIAQDITEDYHSYTFKEKDGSLKNVNHIRGYKKLIYKNLYPNIDVEYTFHPDNGIKYALILNPGADISKVKMKYDGIVKLNRNRDLNISTLFGDIIDHAPVTYYAHNNKNISSAFLVKNNIVSFSLPNGEGRGGASTIIIDPWVQTPALSNTNCVWECEKDGAGNAYIIGGDSPMRLRKYDLTGTAVWTYNTPWDTAGGWLGTFITDLAGNSFVTNGSTSAIQKINTSGAMVWNAGGGGSDEYWNIAFNCDQTKLIVGGTKGNFGLPPDLKGAIFNINTSNGNVTNTKIVGYSRTTMISGFPMTVGEEVRSITSSRNAKYYFLTLDTIGAISQDFSTCPSGNLFNINHTYAFGYKCEDYRVKGNSGIMAIRANRNFVYTQNGTTIHKRSLATGAIISSAAIAGGISTASQGLNQVGNSGIDIDSCGNIYVGSGNAVIKYDANLNVITSVALPFKVYDVAVSYTGNIIVCGATGNASVHSGRTGYVQSINMSSCNPMVLFCCDATVCPAGPFCTNNAPVTLTPVTAGGTWSGPGVNSSGVFNPATAGAGIHNIVYTLACGSDSITIKVNCCGAAINPAGPFCITASPTTLTAAASGGTWSGTGITNTSTGAFSPSTAGAGIHTVIYTIVGCGSDSIHITVNTCATLTACKEPNGNITVSPGTGTYTWYKQTITQDCSTCLGAPFPACTAPPGCAITDTVWTQFATGITVTPPSTFPIVVKNTTGDSLLITSLASLSLCSNTCPALTVTTSNIVNDSCFGQTNGSFNASTTGGASPYDYVLKNSGGTTVATFTNIAGTQSFTALPAGTYTLNVLDTNNCPGTTTITITQPPAPTTVAAAGPDQSLCSNAATLAGNAPTVGTGTWTLVSGTGTIATPASASSGLTGLGVGANVFQWTITNPPCPSTSDQVTITNTGGGPTVTIISHVNVTCYDGNNGSATASGTGGSGNLSYSWSLGGGNLATSTNMVAGTYTVTVTDGSTPPCSGVAIVVITQPPVIVIDSVSTVPANCGNNDGSATVYASGGTGILTYSWNTSPVQTTVTATNLSATSYSVTVTDSSNCNNTTSATVTSIGGPTANAGTNVTISAGSSTPLSASGGGTYLWIPPTGLSCDTCQATSASPVRTTTYCVSVFLGGCSDTACVTITVTDTIPAGGGCGTLFLPTGSVYAPNAFTPDNNDFLNDVYKPVANCVHDYNFMIFDRWGEKIFETTNHNDGWNGYYKGKLCKPDVYVYKISFVDDTKNDFHQYIGHVTLLK